MDVIVFLRRFKSGKDLFLQPSSEDANGVFALAIHWFHEHMSHDASTLDSTCHPFQFDCATYAASRTHMKWIALPLYHNNPNSYTQSPSTRLLHYYSSSQAQSLSTWLLRGNSNSHAQRHYNDISKNHRKIACTEQCQSPSLQKAEQGCDLDGRIYMQSYYSEQPFSPSNCAITWMSPHKYLRINIMNWTKRIARHITSPRLISSKKTYPTHITTQAHTPPSLQIYSAYNSHFNNRNQPPTLHNSSDFLFAVTLCESLHLTTALKIQNLG